MNQHQSLPTVEIDLDALCANYRLLKARAAGAEVSAVVKCDGYGLGAAEAATALATRESCKTFFVTYFEEGLALRAALAGAAPKATIHVFDGLSGIAPADFIAARLTPVLNSAREASAWAEARGGAAALHVDTGMNRLGAPLAEIDEIAGASNLKIDLFISHLACASEPDHPMNERQRLAFEAAARKFPGARRSLAASGGALMDKCYHYDLVRPGIALYGASPFDDAVPNLKPVARLTAPIIQVREIAPGETIGYGATFKAERLTRLATVALGYGDGFLRAASNRGAAILKGAKCPILGRVSMDLIVLDATAAPRAGVGDRAEFFGPARAIEDAARDAGTMPYELLTDLGRRVRRVYCGLKNG